MRITKFDGVMCALITPYDKKGMIDVEMLRKHTNYVIENGVDTVLAVGGSGQYTNMDYAQREVGVKAVVAEAKGRVPVIAGVLEPGLGEAIKNGKMCKDAGADALLVLPPYYVGITQQGIYEYFQVLDQELNTPIVVYNYPYRTGTNIMPETLVRMMREIPGVFGVKECADFAQFLNLVRLLGDDGTIFSGSDLMFADQVAAGAKGGVLAASCILPRQYAEIYRHAKGGDLKKAHKVIFRCFALVKALFGDGLHPAPLKYAMSLSGQEAGEWYPPVVEPNEEMKNLLRTELEKLGMLV